MNVSFRHPLWLLTLTWLVGAQLALAQEPAVPPPTPVPPVEQPQLDVERADNEVDAETRGKRMERRLQQHLERKFGRDHENVIVHIGGDSSLPAGEYADSVIALFGSASAAGDVREAVVAIGGNATATGRVGDAVVAMFGDAYVDNEVGHDVVAIFGNVTLGPNAVVDGEVVSMGGVIKRDPAAQVHGPQQQIAFGEHFGRLEWLKPWFQHALLYGRPLAFEPSVTWAWWLAFGVLGLYVLLALMFDDSLRRCVTTLEERPAQTALAAILSVLLLPVLIVLVLVTVIGIALVPFLILGLLCAAWFGKAAILAAIGRRITRLTGIGAFGHIAVATLIGGLIVLLLYTVPVFGFIVFNLIGALGLGVVAYTLLLAMRTNNAPVAAPAGPSNENVSAAPANEPAGIAGDGSTVPPPSSPPIGPSNMELIALPRAGFWIRMGALALDVLLIALVVNWLDPSKHFFLVALAGYGALMWKLRGTTIGGIICNLRVVRTDGRDIEWETAIVRALTCFLSLIPAGLGFIWMVFDSNRQTWHDKIAGTVVVRVPRNQPPV